MKPIWLFCRDFSPRRRSVSLSMIMLFCVLCRAETMYRLAVRSNYHDSALVCSFEQALDTVFGSRLSKPYRVVAASNQELFAIESTVCSAQIDVVDSNWLTFKIDIFFPSASTDSFWSASFSLPNNNISFEHLVVYILKLLQNRNFKNLFLSRIQILGAAGASVIIDSVLMEQKTPFESFLISKKHVIEIKKNRFLSQRFIFDLSTTKDTTITVDFWKSTQRIRHGLLYSSLLSGFGGLYLHYYQNLAYNRYSDVKIGSDIQNRLYRKYQVSVIGRNSLFSISIISFLLAISFSVTIPF